MLLKIVKIKIAKIQRNEEDLQSGQVVEIITNPNYNIPTTAAKFGNSLYTVNAIFGRGGGQSDTTYEIVKTII